MSKALQRKIDEARAILDAPVTLSQEQRDYVNFMTHPICCACPEIEPYFSEPFQQACLPGGELSSMTVKDVMLLELAEEYRAQWLDKHPNDSLLTRKELQEIKDAFAEAALTEPVDEQYVADLLRPSRALHPLLDMIDALARGQRPSADQCSAIAAVCTTLHEKSTEANELKRREYQSGRADTLEATHQTSIISLLGGAMIDPFVKSRDADELETRVVEAIDAFRDKSGKPLPLPNDVIKAIAAEYKKAFDPSVEGSIKMNAELGREAFRFMRTKIQECCKPDGPEFGAAFQKTVEAQKESLATIERDRISLDAAKALCRTFNVTLPGWMIE